MKLLVMGAGYVGMRLLRHLHGKHELLVTTTRTERQEELRGSGQVFPLSKAHYLSELASAMELADGMVVLVAPKGGESYRQTYVSTAEMITSIAQRLERPFYLVYTSSTSVCEGADSEWISEDTPLAPFSEKAEILYSAEQLYLQRCPKACVLRLGGIYGPGRELRDRALCMSGRVLPGSAQRCTNHIHVEDIIRGIAFCLERSLTGVYHLVNDDHPTRQELYAELCESAGLPLPVWAEQDVGAQADSCKISNQKIKQAGFAFQSDLLPKS